MRTAKTLIRLGGCPGFRVFVGRILILLVLSCRGSNKHQQPDSSIRVSVSGPSFNFVCLSVSEAREMKFLILVGFVMLWHIFLDFTNKLLI